MSYTVKCFTNVDDNYIKICETTTIGKAEETAMILCDLLGKENIKVTKKLPNGSEVYVEGISIFENGKAIKVFFNNKYGEVITYNVLTKGGKIS